MSTLKTLLQIAGAAPRKPQWKDAALILIDHQTEYTTGGVPLDGIDAAIDEIAQLLKQARAAGAPVFHVVHHAKPGAALFDPQREYVNVIDGLQPQDGEVTVVKALPNAFANTTLDTELKKTGKKELIIAGFATHMCISATTRSALDHGYVSTIVAAACATRDLPDALGNGVVPATEVQRAALAALADRFATVLPNAAALA
ncbi:nicotinamidase-like amidase [Herbaspirillum sp. CF444]|uniref:cysteine hydrolase family protein n=1 Tax=Herbaspirillum sp. CF444 TaxID=1144319 RepID=UPI0002724594|nr:cysteine hydrolase family protein [Herbaspirillum sp. CF444]EJL92618.1 nicotinamidase-like amidase [Herbaspirillum sp. CF444]